jgi:hypothetical protein
VARRCGWEDATRPHDVLDASGACSLTSDPPLAACAGNDSPATIGRRGCWLIQEAVVNDAAHSAGPRKK